jgi:hypothetical protein
MGHRAGPTLGVVQEIVYGTVDSTYAPSRWAA